MSENVQHDPSAPVTPTPDSPTPPSTGAPPPEPWRVPADDPREWARGKTAEQLLADGQTMFQGLMNVAVGQQQYQQQQAPPTQTRSDNPSPWDVSDDAVVDGRTFKAAVAAMVPMATQTNANMGQLAQMSFNMVRVEKEVARIFQKFEPEIRSELATLPLPMWTLDNIRRVAKMVASSHLDELATERAQEMANNMGLSVRSDGTAAGRSGSTPDLSLESDSLPAVYRERLKKQGVTWNTVREFCRSNNMTPEAWFKMAEKNPVIGEG